VASPVPEGVPDTSAQYEYCYFRVPDTSQFLVNGAPNCYQGLAREGAYIPLKYVGALSAQQYRVAGRQQVVAYHYPAVAGKQDMVVAESMLFIRGNDGPIDDETVNPQNFVSGDNMESIALALGNDAASIIPVMGGTTSGVPASAGHPFVSTPTDMATSITFIENISVSSTLRVKTRLYLECISNGNGAISPFAHRSPLLDQRALDCVAVVSQTGQDAYPARFNSFGEILGNIWEGLKNVATPVLNIAKFIPGAGAFANMGLAGMNVADSLKNAIMGGHG